MPAVKDLSELLKGLPRGAWVAISHDEQQVVSYGAELKEVLETAKATGEDDPIVVRVPEGDAVLFL